MAITKLPVNFKDDIIDTAINEKRRYNIEDNSDGTKSLEDVTIYEQVGSYFGAEQINQTNETVNELIDKTSNIDNTKDSEKSVLYAESAGVAGSATMAESVKNDFILINQQTLVFANNICTISDGRITADSLADVYFTSDTINTAEKAVISVETYNGKVVLNAGREISGIIKASIRIRVVKS